MRHQESKRSSSWVLPMKVAAISYLASWATPHTPHEAQDHQKRTKQFIWHQSDGYVKIKQTGEIQGIDTRLPRRFRATS